MSEQEKSRSRVVAWLWRPLCALTRHTHQRDIEGSAVFFSRRCWCGSFWVEFGAPRRGSWHEDFRL